MNTVDRRRNAPGAVRPSAVMLTLSGLLAACGQSPSPAAGPSPAGAHLVTLASAKDGAVFTLASVCSAKVLDVSGISQDDGAKVIVWSANGGANQQWKLSATDSGYYKLIAQHSNKVLDVAAAGTADGPPVQQWTDRSGLNQQWAFTDLGDGQYKLTPRSAPGTALDVSGASRNDGAQVQIWTDNGTCAQRWTLSDVAPNGTPPSPTPAPAPTDGSGPTAWRAADFLDTIGVNAHFDRLQDGNTIWAKQQGALRQKLLDSGITHVRTAQAGNLAAGSAYMTYLQGLSGVKIDLQTDWRQPVNDLPGIASRLNGQLYAIEAVNEPDIQGWDASVWPGQVVSLQRTLRDLRGANASLKNVTLYGPSVLGDDGAQAVASAGGIGGAFDCLNAHPYTGTANPELLLSDGGLDGGGYGSVAWHRARLSKMGGPSDCLIATEAGEHNAVHSDDGHLGASEKVAGKYMPRIYLEYARKGIARTYVYELVDEWTTPDDPQANFGLLRHDLSEKPAFKAVKHMIALLKDSGSASTSFTPGQLNYTLGGDTGSLDQMLFQKADGTFYLAVWLGKRSWDWQHRSEISIPNQSVTLSVPSRRSYALHTLDDAGNMSDGDVQTISGGTLNLSVSDRVTFVELK